MPALPANRLRSRRGFALIVTVVLVAFLVLILVGLATFTRVETQVADNTEALSRARQNALAGLNLAVGQLQQHLGRDERVTARSELIGGVGPGNNAYITGVWNTNVGGPLPAAPNAWLISGTEGAAAPDSTTGLQDASTAVTAAFDDEDGWVFVVYNNAVGPAVADRPRRVRLAKQAIEVPRASVPGLGGAGDVAIGHYAYWVGDEGVKASAAVVAPDYSTLTYDNGGLGGDAWNNAIASNTAETGATLRSRLAQFAQPYRRLDHFYPGMDYTAGSTVAELGRITDLPQLRFITNSAPAANQLANFRARFHDVTPLARGVLARTDAGNAAGTDRLRADLSASVAAIAPATSAVNDYWVTRPFEYSTNPPDVLGAYYRFAGRKDAATGSNLSFSIAPVLTEGGVFVSFGNDSGGNLILRTTLLGEFWNPYAATLRASAAANLRMRVRTDNNAVVFNVVDRGANSHTITVPANTTLATGELATAAPSQEFKPGEVLRLTTLSTGIFSAASNGAQDTTFGSGAAGSHPIASCDLPALNDGDLVIELQENTSGSWVTLQEFPLAARVTEPGITPGAADDIVGGYGFELSRDFALWSNPAADNARDPRAATFTPADHFEPLATGAHWSANASENKDPAGDPADKPFANLDSVVLFDLPRQEIISLAQLKHLPGEIPYELVHGANDRGLFDRAFVSTVPRNAANWNYATQARPSPFLEVFIPERAPGAEIGEATDSANVVADKRRDSLRDGAISSRFHLIRGAFNINSTSSAAWAAVLGTRIEAWDTQQDIATNVNRALFRVPHGAQEKGLANLVTTNINDDDPDAPAAAALDDDSALSAIGRRLTNAEITALADAIVAEIIARGRPFASLADFIGAPSSAGASRTLLQKAIDDSQVNDAISTVNFRHSAGAITPADIVTAIAPFMSARSDTFKIRVYGDARNPVADTVTGRAWCEAIVQRVPDLAEDPTAAAADVVRANPAAYPFGRKFQIISFRWLTSDDL